MKMRRFCTLGIIAVFAFLPLCSCKEELPEKVRMKKPHTQILQSVDGETQGKKILLVHSYQTGYPWVDAITRGVRKILDGSGARLEIFYMDTKRNTAEAWKKRAGELAERKMKEHKPDVVIAADDNAQQYFAMKYVGRGIPFVFCGVNADPSKYGYPASNITGIIERPHFKDTLEFLSELKNVRRIGMLSSDDETSIGAFNFMKEEFVDVKVTEWKLVGRFDDWKRAVYNFNDSVDAFGIYMYHTLKDENSPTSLDPAAVMSWTAAHAKVPTMGFFDFGIEDGLVAGFVESGFEHGEKAAKYALDILKGVPLASLPITEANIGIRMVNRDAAFRLGIPLGPQVLKSSRVVSAKE